MALTAEDLAAQLRAEIESGELPVGAKLPSLNVLVTSRKIGRGAAQDAIKVLQAEGLVESRHGKGNYVRQRRNRLSVGFPLSDNFDVDIVAAVMRIDEVEAPSYIVAECKAWAGDPVVLRMTRRLLKDRLVEMQESFIPAGLARGTAIVYHDPGEGGVHARLAEQGVAPTRFTDRVVARRPTREEGEAMKIRPPVGLVLEAVSLAFAGDRCVEVVRRVMDADVFELVSNTER
jgi:GntR family transcriptional regulator